MSEEEYTAENIAYVRNGNHIRHRPAMYVGDTGEMGLHHLLWLLLDNSLIEVKGVCRNIQIDLFADGSCSIRDDGTGIPVHVVEEVGQRFLELAFTRGGFIFPTTPYRTMTGPHALGLVCVCSLSRHLLVEVRRDGLLWRQEYERGRAVTPLQPVGQADGSGTSITFTPDPEIFTGKVAFGFPRIYAKLREIACLGMPVDLRLIDHRTCRPLEASFGPPLSLADLLEVHSRGSVPVHRRVVHRRAGDVEVAFRWVRGQEYTRVGLVNGGRTDEGTHFRGLLEGIAATWRMRLGARISQRFRLLGLVVPIRDACLFGLVAAVSVALESPTYNCQAKTRLNSVEAIGQVARVARGALADFLRDHPDEADLIVAHLREPRPVDVRTAGPRSPREASA